MKINDEILNKYIDGELSHSEINELRSLLNSSEEAMKQYNALLLVHKHLKKIKEEKVSTDFTSLVMSKISRKFQVKKEDRYFIFSISSVFILASLVITGFLLSSIISSGSESSGSLEVIDGLTSFIKDITSSVINIFSGKSISVFGSIISFAILVSAYFFFTFHKKTQA